MVLTNNDEETNSKQVQTDDTCSYCQEFIESKEAHNVSGFCPNNKEAQTLALYHRYGYQNFGQGRGFSSWMMNNPGVQS